MSAFGPLVESPVLRHGLISAYHPEADARCIRPILIASDCRSWWSTARAAMIVTPQLDEAPACASIELRM
jgi:hypothetical protein